MHEALNIQLLLTHQRTYCTYAKAPTQLSETQMSVTCQCILKQQVRPSNSYLDYNSVKVLVR